MLLMLVLDSGAQVILPLQPPEQLELWVYYHSRQLTDMFLF
jgi:hypothetical protein